MGSQQVGLFERRVVVRPISIVKTISKLTNAFTMMKFLAMFCLFIALFNEMEAKPIEVKPASTLQVVSERASFDNFGGGDSGVDEFGNKPGMNSKGCYNTSEGCHYDDDDREDVEDTGEDDDGTYSDEDDDGDEKDDKTADDEKEDIEEDGDEEDEEENGELGEN